MTDCVTGASTAAGRLTVCPPERRSITSRRNEELTAQGLIDTTEMYLRTIFELEEEGVLPLRARIA